MAQGDRALSVGDQPFWVCYKPDDLQPNDHLFDVYESQMVAMSVLQGKLFQEGEAPFHMRTVVYAGGHRIETIASGGPWSENRGIAGALIEEASAILGTPIYSSKKCTDDEFRTADADKVWEKLCNQSKASYCPSEDRYRLPPWP